MTDATAAVSPLRRRMIDDMSLRNLAPATQRSYIHAVKRFSQYHGRSPDRLGLEDVRAFQVCLVPQGVSWGALNPTVCAHRFYYGVTLDRVEILERIAYRKAHYGHIGRVERRSSCAELRHSVVMSRLARTAHIPASLKTPAVIGTALSASVAPARPHRNLQITKIA